MLIGPLPHLCPQIGRDLVGAGEAQRVVDDAHEAGGGDGTDAGDRREPAAQGEA